MSVKKETLSFSEMMTKRVEVNELDRDIDKILCQLEQLMERCQDTKLLKYAKKRDFVCKNIQEAVMLKAYRDKQDDSVSSLHNHLKKVMKLF